MSEFITLTESAAAKITNLMLEEEKKSAEVGLRVYVQGGGCSGFQYGLSIEEIARGELGLIRPGERLFIVTDRPVPGP